MARRGVTARRERALTGEGHDAVGCRDVFVVVTRASHTTSASARTYEPCGAAATLSSSSALSMSGPNDPTAYAVRLRTVTRPRRLSVPTAEPTLRPVGFCAFRNVTTVVGDSGTVQICDTSTRVGAAGRWNGAATSVGAGPRYTRALLGNTTRRSTVAATCSACAFPCAATEGTWRLDGCRRSVVAAVSAAAAGGRGRHERRNGDPTAQGSRLARDVRRASRTVGSTVDVGPRTSQSRTSRRQPQVLPPPAAATATSGSRSGPGGRRPRPRAGRTPRAGSRSRGADRPRAGRRGC